jgi:hypothetical protein
MCDQVKETLEGMGKDPCASYGFVMHLLYNTVKLVSDVEDFSIEQYMFKVG